MFDILGSCLILLYMCTDYYEYFCLTIFYIAFYVIVVPVTTFLFIWHLLV